MDILVQTAKRYRDTTEIYEALLENTAREKTKGIGITKLIYTSFLLTAPPYYIWKFFGDSGC
jgi:hypothetical protein